MRKGTKVAAAEAAVTASEAIAVEDLEEAKRLAAKFEALGGDALTMALAQEAEPGDPFRGCWLMACRVHGCTFANKLGAGRGKGERWGVTFFENG
jgi:hypothetical protein